jgi:hypothetical protein
MRLQRPPFKTPSKSYRPFFKDNAASKGDDDEDSDKDGELDEYDENDEESEEGGYFEENDDYWEAYGQYEQDYHPKYMIDLENEDTDAA